MTHRVVLVQATEPAAEERAGELRRAGYEVDVFVNSRDGAVSLFKWLKYTPDAFVLDLGRSPSVSRAKAIWLRNRKATRKVPLVFCGGTSDKVSEVRGYLPDATYTEWETATEALATALNSPVAEPIVPDVMAPYRGATLARKLNLRAGKLVALIGAPDGFVHKIDGLPAGIRFDRTGNVGGDTGLLFVRSLSELVASIAAADRAVVRDGALWVIWPKRASGLKSGLTHAVVREYMMARHWVDFKFASVDETWTGMVYRRRDNTGWLAARGTPTGRRRAAPSS